MLAFASVYFNKSEDNTWTWRAMVKGEEINGGEKGTLVEQATGKLIFDTDGRLAEQTIDKSAFNFTKGALPDQFIRFNFGDDKKNGGTGLQVTQYGTASEAYKTIQDGATAGTMAGLWFVDSGELIAVYSNGQSVKLSQLALAKFENSEGLFKFRIETDLERVDFSGQPTVGAPISGGRGSISPKNLESSTTDIASEFINLMTSQRNFQANSRVINTADDMLKEVINLNK